ncbi:hypothetical protein ATZ33_16550 [Enterococcus silesiacus]|uniref:Uncharacterized protein n=1 Tax=Enterococcus silesiacus TaxID=332949 RepID=A0A0S3KF74_9ENTE|nr:hypothetical protein [Enterococcus silesiacus]ALS02931.1 hypothetical protein ATZ33_16550 [Enterococcus silesiacus]OJG91880.1 hypothetical protein RV15_GL000320 [Enterococcus silesiacus]
MFNKRKIKKWFEQAQQALNENQMQQAVYFLKLVIETSIKNGGIQLNECFSSFVLLGDIYNEEQCFEEADRLYRMAASMDFSAKFVLLKKELFHDDSNYEVASKNWLKKNMIDSTDIIQASDGKNWTFLIEEGEISYSARASSKESNKAALEEFDVESLWTYEDCLDSPSM